MFRSPSPEGGGQRPGAQGGNGFGGGGEEGRTRGNLGVSFTESLGHTSGRLRFARGSSSVGAARGAGPGKEEQLATTGKGSVSAPLSHAPPS